MCTHYKCMHNNNNNILKITRSNIFLVYAHWQYCIRVFFMMLSTFCLWQLSFLFTSLALTMTLVLWNCSCSICRHFCLNSFHNSPDICITGMTPSRFSASLGGMLPSINKPLELQLKTGVSSRWLYTQIFSGF